MEQVATRLLIIDKGRKLVEGTTTELFDPSQTLVELQTLDNEAALSIIKNSSWQNTLQPQRGNGVLLKMHRNNIPDFHNWLVQQNIRLMSLQPKHSLEDYFLQVTSGEQHVAAFTN